MSVSSLTSLLFMALCIAPSRSSFYFPHVDDVITGVRVEHEERPRLRRDVSSESLQSHLRILAVYDSSFTSQPDSDIFKTKIIESAISFYESTLYVRHPISKFLLDRKCATSSVYPFSNNGEITFYCDGGCAPVTKCGLVTVPQEHLNVCRWSGNGYEKNNDGSPGAGIRGFDFVLYISSIEESRCAGDAATLAFSAHCQMDATWDRPIAGYINICPNRLSTALGRFDQALFTAMHEILHALGFAHSLYAFYRQPDGTPLTPRSDITGRPNLGFFHQGVFNWSERFASWQTRQWLTAAGLHERRVMVVHTPNVLREARQHFGCPTMVGLDLEDQRGLGVAYTHWEKRLMENDIMAPTYTHRAVVSRITLALMHDSGWYIPDYTRAETLYWGKGLGCDFVTKSCFQYIQERLSRNETILPYCTSLSTSKRLFCSEDNKAYGHCNLVQYTSPLEPMYQNIIPEFIQSEDGSRPTAPSAFYGGNVATADYCPFVQEFNWQRSDKDEGRGDGVVKVERTTHCTDSQNNPTPGENFGMESYGSDSRCIQVMEPWRYLTSKERGHLIYYGAGCYTLKCSSQYGLVIYVNSEPYQCQYAGQVLAIRTLSSAFEARGTLKCPDCSLFCQECVRNPQPMEVQRSCTEQSCVQPQKNGAQRLFLWSSLFTMADLLIILIALLGGDQVMLRATFL